MLANQTVAKSREKALTRPRDLQVERFGMAVCSDNPKQNRREQSARRSPFSQRSSLSGHVIGENLHAIFARRSLDCKECLRR